MLPVPAFKQCTCCKETLSSDKFLFLKKRRCLNSWCRACVRNGQKKVPIEQRRQKQREWRKKNHTRYLELAANWRGKNPAKIKATNQEMYAKSKENGGLKYKRRLTCNQKNSTRRMKTDPSFRMAVWLRKSMRWNLNQRVNRDERVGLLGCSVSELVCHLEALFSTGMTWENYGSVWHIDHKRPITSFNLSDSEQLQACAHYSNLQPLFAKDNLQKGSKYVRS